MKSLTHHYVAPGKLSFLPGTSASTPVKRGWNQQYQARRALLRIWPDVQKVLSPEPSARRLLPGCNIQIVILEKEGASVVHSFESCIQSIYCCVIYSHLNLQTASPTQWAWNWANCRRQWRTGEPGMLQSTGLQRVRHGWVAEQQQSKTKHNTFYQVALFSWVQEEFVSY